MAAYQSAISKDVSLLRARARHLLAVWAAMVVAKVGEGNGFGLDSAGRSLTPAFESAMADLTSLRRAGVVLGNRKVLTVLGLEGLRDSVPKLLTNLGGAAVLVTGFPPKPDLQRDWRSGLRWEGAGSVTLLTRATITELTLDTARDLAEG